MADSLTANIKATIQTPGGNNNSWGGIDNTNWTTADNKIGSVTSISTTGGTTTLSDAQEIVNAIIISGVLVADATIVFSGRGGTWFIENNTTGSFNVTAKVTGQTGIVISQAAGAQPAYCNGTDIKAGGGLASATALPAGFGPVPYCGTTAPATWVRANGRTIGNAASGGTERANADTSNLFAVLWGAYANAQLAIQDSAGTPTTRGASAAADYAANKRLSLPDLRGRAFVGLDDMGNSAAGRLSAIITSPTVNGFSGGTETVVLVEANLAAHTHGMSHTHTFSATSGTESATHTHTGTTSSDGAHTHGVTVPATGAVASGSGGSISPFNNSTGYTTTSNGAHTHTMTTGTASATHTHIVSGTTDPSAGNTGSTGSGTAHSNMQPSWLGTFIIKL